MKARLIAPVVLIFGCVQAQSTLKSIQLRVEPADRKVRPLETAVVQVRAYGEVKDKEGNTKQGRLQRGGWKIRMAGEGGGWISKPFLYQGKDDERFLETEQEAWKNLLMLGVGQFTVKDSVLYTAPEKPGKYTLEVELGEVKATAEFEVTPEAPTSRKPERTSFPDEQRTADPYRNLAENYAPFIAQETWYQPKSDFPTRLDYDGDWDGANNWDHLDEGTSQAYVYYAVMETATHWFVHYNFFHPRDYSDNCVAGTCHENDNEGIILAVLKDGSEFGKLQAMETLAHNNVYSYVNAPGIRNGAHDIDGNVALYQQSHPMVFVEAGGHGVLSAGDYKSLFDVKKGDFKENTGITLVYGGRAARPRHASDRNVSYELLPILDHWWPRAQDGGGKERTFDAFYRYEPFGGRPGTRAGTIGGSLYGRKFGENKAKPFWGWHDARTLKKRILNTGQWGLDPAYAMAKNLTYPAPWSTDYTFNPYLGAGLAPATIQAPEAPREGSCEISVIVDGSLFIHIQRDAADYQVISGQPEQGASMKCTSPLPSGPVRDLGIERLAGRGKVVLDERPSDSNGYRARIRVDDPSRGADSYRIRIRWNM